MVQGEGKVSPSKVGVWATRMLIAEPVMYADSDTRGIMSTIHPIRTKPMKKTIAPERTAKADAIWNGWIPWSAN